MRRGWGFSLVLLAATAAFSAGAPPSRIERTSDFVRRVNSAVDRGVAALGNLQSADGSFADFPEFPGATTALAYHALRACGAGKDDPSVKRAWDALRRAYKPRGLKTYAAALYLLAIASHGDAVPNAADERDVKLAPEDMKWASEIARCLVAGQGAQGVWWYDLPSDAKSTTPGASRPVPTSVWDNSNTQYALLGLKAAARCGVPVDAGVWTRSLDHFLSTQDAAGPEARRGPPPAATAKGATETAAPTDHARGWAYETRAAVRGATTSMTAGAVSSVVICRSELHGTRAMTPKLDAASERAAWDGLAWIGTNWAPDPTPPLPDGADAPPEVLKMMAGGGLDLYTYYGVERAGMLAGVEWMAGLDWYGKGAERLLATQAADGSWTGLHNGLVAKPPESADASRRVADVCFALLFLKKGTTPVRRGAVTEAGGDSDINFAEAAKVTGKDLEDVLDLVLSRWRKASDAEVRRRLFDGATSIGPKIVEPLLKRMASDDVETRRPSFELLKRATGLDFGYVADVSPDAREAALEKWRAWWMGAKDKLVYDAATKRLVAP